MCNAPDNTGAKVATRSVGGTSWATTVIVDLPRRRPVDLVVNQGDDLAMTFGRFTALRPYGSAWSAPRRSAGGVLAILPYGSALRLWWDSTGLNAQRIYVA